jgi:hypothetical protein
MTDVQILTLALSFLVPVSLLIYSNSRITDTRVALDGKITDIKETLRAEIQTLRAEVSGEMKAQRQFLDAIMSKLEDIDRRLSTFDQKR